MCHPAGASIPPGSWRGAGAGLVLCLGRGLAARLLGDPGAVLPGPRPHTSRQHTRAGTVPSRPRRGARCRAPSGCQHTSSRVPRGASLPCAGTASTGLEPGNSAQTSSRARRRVQCLLDMNEAGNLSMFQCQCSSGWGLRLLMQQTVLFIFGCTGCLVLNK